MIKLFNTTDTLFSSNGDKVIVPLRAKIHKEDNGSFYLDLDADLSYVNDLPFIISASALKEWQENTSLNSTLSMVNPLSLGNTLNTQENNIQPIEVDNIEPLEEEENE